MTASTYFNTQDVSEGRPNLILNIHYMTTTTDNHAQCLTHFTQTFKCSVTHLNMGRSKGPHHIRPTVQFSLSRPTCQHSFRLASQYFNLLKRNVNYSGRTAPLTSKVAFYIFIQQIYVLNILNMVYILRFFLFKMQFVS